MNIRQHLIHVTVNSVPESDKNINLYTNYLPPMLYKQAQVAVVLEQNIHESVSIYGEMKDFVICQIRSTVQHEAAHRQDEEQRHSTDQEHRQKFEDFARPGRAEPIAERAEEQCVQPESVSGAVEQVSINDLFEQAKSTANINPAYKNDIVAATLATSVAGQYLAKDLPMEEWSQDAQQISPNAYKMGNKLLIDVRKIVQPYIINKPTTLPANIQKERDGAVDTDLDLYKKQEGPSTVPSVPAVPSIPSI